MVDKEHVLAEIKRTARGNGGVPLGRQKFEAETGIKYHYWGKHWARWSDAQIEAGFVPNKLQAAIGEEVLLESFISVMRELGRFPTVAELRLKHARDAGFPSEKTFGTRFGGQAALASRLLQYCGEHSGYQDVVKLCEARASKPLEDGALLTSDPVAVELGHVYLLRSGRYSKIGRSNAVGRREYELAIQLPERAEIIHSIKTDDPAGIEAYWHSRFATKRKGGEWFALGPADVQAFKRRKSM
jgi:Meiotically Up-regulated Gene 113 (MUG113) protein